LTGDFAFAIVFPALLIGEVTETACPFSGPFAVDFEDAVVVEVGCVANPLVDETDLVVMLTPAFDLKLKRTGRKNSPSAGSRRINDKVQQTALQVPSLL
jgi:hypothetical protein